MDSRNRAYWLCTGLFCAGLTGSGLAHLLRAAPIVEGMNHLGYPLYVTTMLGTAKLLGVLALLAPGRPLLKEWAYAGFAFNLLGASTSHALAGDSIAGILPPLLIGSVGVASYLFRPSERRLPQSRSLRARISATDSAAQVSHS